MPWVFDASIAMAWCFDDEKTLQTDALLDRLATDPATVPNLWHLEVANVLVQAIRKKPKSRITSTQRAQFLAMLDNATIHVDPHTHPHAWNSTLDLADKFQLSTYDAAYLELALRLDTQLATLDKALRAAAKSLGLSVLP